MQIPPHADGLLTMLALARQLSQASMTVALLRRAPDELMPLLSEPPMAWPANTAWRWRIPRRPDEEPGGLQWLPLANLPSMVTAGLPFVPVAVAYLDSAALGDQLAGGVLFLWDAAQAHHVATLTGQDAGAHPVLLLRTIYARLLDGRDLMGQKIESDAQFHDIFNSVPQGIVVVKGQGAHAQVNRVMSEVLQLPHGQVPVDELAQAMQAARRRCSNAAELDVAYQPLHHALNAEVVVHWELDDRVWRVDTHPILNSGHNGRVWLFQDVTASIRLERMLRRDASYDALTGLFNRRAFFDQAHAHYLAQSPAHDAPPDGDAAQRLALLMFDIDHFKQINDSFGHPVGDRVLQEVARRAQAQLRDGDVLARYGGEEFIVLLCGSNQAIARAVAERLRAAMAEPPVQIDGVAVNVRISVGLALRLDADETLARTIERADCNLYRAKREGRNRVVDDSL
ncbi:MAG: GGDEF domain-containing protein [Aquabacterium sp.]|nr:GGDEF domain-containing protein [Aquabacterium sp.]